MIMHYGVFGSGIIAFSKCICATDPCKVSQSTDVSSLSRAKSGVIVRFVHCLYYPSF